MEIWEIYESEMTMLNSIEIFIAGIADGNI